MALLVAAGAAAQAPETAAESPPTASAPPARDTWLYWRGLEQLGRVRLDGSGAEILAEAQLMTAGPVIDHGAGKLYWAERLEGRGMSRLLRSDLDGSRTEVVVAELWIGGGLDVSADSLLWSPGHGRISRGDLDGAYQDEYLDLPEEARDDGGRHHVAVLAAAGKTVFWIDPLANAIRRYDPAERRIGDVLPPVESHLDKLIAHEVSGGPHGIAVAGRRLFWSEPSGGRIFSARLDGSRRRELVAGDDLPLDVEVHRGKLYWCDLQALRRASLDGSAGERIAVDEEVYPQSIELTGDWIYFADTVQRRIRRVRHDGSGLEDVVAGDDLITGPTFDVEAERRVSSASPTLRGIEVGGGKVYWSESWSNRILRSDLDGGDVEDFVTGLEIPGDLLLADGWLYWTSSDGIQRARTDGSGVEDVTGHDANGLAIAGRELYFTDGILEGIYSLPLDGGSARALREIASRPLARAALADVFANPEQNRMLSDLAVDGDRIYWSELAPGRIRSADFDGGNLVEVVPGPLSAYGLAVRDGAVCWGSFDEIVCARLERPDLRWTVLRGHQALALGLSRSAPTPARAEAGNR